VVCSPEVASHTVEGLGGDGLQVALHGDYGSDWPSTCWMSSRSKTPTVLDLGGVV
jgi:hypothetical protein